MNFFEAVNVIRQELIGHRLSGGKPLWATILKQIAKGDSFDGHYADTILGSIRSFLKPLNNKTIISLWRQSDTGMSEDMNDESLFPACCRRDLEMELLREITILAWEEAKDRPKR